MPVPDGARVTRETSPDTRAPALALVIVSTVLLAVRFHAASHVGFGDSEALYACYALHPQPAYLDHPGLVGLFARVLARPDRAPTPASAHLVTAGLATLLPWLAVLAARGAGASRRSALLAGLVVALVPEIAIGLFGMTPDLLLSFAWLGALTLACVAARLSPSSPRAAAYLLGAGLLAGIATSAKLSGLGLMLALAIAYTAKPLRAHARTVWPWAGLVAGALVLEPIVAYETRLGWPMLRHRLIDTQADAGFSLRNLAAVPLGQLAYLSPLIAVAAAVVGYRLWKARFAPEADGVTALLFAAFVVPLTLLLPLCLWSRVAEPHWLAPPLLSLPLFWARASGEAGKAPRRRFLLAALITSSAIVGGAHAWILAPQLMALAPKSYDPRRDITSELYGWPEAIDLVRESAAEQILPGYEKGDVVVVAPHWVLCAQLHAALAGELPVGCASPIEDDFDTWYPRATWRDADTILFFTDNRLNVDPAVLFPTRSEIVHRRVVIMRGGRRAREFSVVVLSRRAEG